MSECVHIVGLADGGMPDDWPFLATASVDKSALIEVFNFCPKCGAELVSEQIHPLTVQR